MERNTGNGPKSYTFTRRPVELKYYEHFHDVCNAIVWEKQIKGWSRKKKEAVSENNWEKIKESPFDKLRVTETIKLKVTAHFFSTTSAQLFFYYYPCVTCR